MRAHFLAELSEYWNNIISFTRQMEGTLTALYGSDKIKAEDIASRNIQPCANAEI